MLAELPIDEDVAYRFVDLVERRAMADFEREASAAEIANPIHRENYRLLQRLTISHAIDVLKGLGDGDRALIASLDPFRSPANKPSEADVSAAPKRANAPQTCGAQVMTTEEFCGGLERRARRSTFVRVDWGDQW